MARIQLTLAAKRDLQNIRRYTLTQWSARQADAYLENLRRKFDLLAAQPRMAPVLLPKLDIRATVHHEHRIAYRPTEDGIEILRVLHTARDLSQIVAWMDEE